MGSKIEFQPGTLYIMDEDGNRVPLGGVDNIDFMADIPECELPIIRYEGDYTMNITCNLTFRLRVKLFGFWNTIRAMIRSVFKRGG